jgi:hypothetical protein
VSESFKSGARLVAERIITRRLNRSKWAQRGIAAFGLTCGLTIGLAEFEEPVATGGMTLAFLAGGAAVAERFITTASADNTVRNYEIARRQVLGEASEPWQVTVLKVSDGSFEPEQKTDIEADSNLTLKSIVSAGITPGFMMLGSAIGTGWAEGLANNPNTAVALALGFGALGAVLQASGEYDTHTQLGAYMRQFDNVDGTSFWMEY